MMNEIKEPAKPVERKIVAEETEKEARRVALTLALVYNF